MEATPSADGWMCAWLCAVVHILCSDVSKGDLNKKEGSGWKPCVAIRPTLLKRLPQRVKVSQGCDWRVAHLDEYVP